MLFIFFVSFCFYMNANDHLVNYDTRPKASLIHCRKGMGISCEYRPRLSYVSIKESEQMPPAEMTYTKRNIN